MIAFINCFTVPAGRDDEFLALWKTVNRYMAAEPGYIDHQLHRSLDPTAAYRFVNLAHWESAETWRTAHDDGFRALVSTPQWADFPSLPGLYDPIHQGTVQTEAA